MRKKGAHFDCTYEGCTSSFSRPDRLKNHLRTHTGERPFTCKYPECGKNFGNSQHLKRHELTHETTFNCTVEGCSEVFSRKDFLKRHIDNIHNKKTTKQYKCTECDKQFNKHNWLQRHMYKHTGIFPYICSYEGCGKGFFLPTKLRRHMTIHEGYTCKIPGCEAKLLKWSLYVAHLKEIHPKVHQCNICDRKFYHPSNLKSHLDIHKEPIDRKVFACEVSGCPRYYFAEKNLTWHVRTYHEERHFACEKEHCHKTFKTKDALDDHVLRHVRRKPRRKKKPKPSLSAIVSGCEDPRKFTYKVPRKRMVTESSEESTTEGEIQYQDTSSDENIMNSASEMSDPEKMVVDNPIAVLSSDSQFDEIQNRNSEFKREKETRDSSAIAGPSTRLSEFEEFVVSKDKYPIQNTTNFPKKHKRFKTDGETPLNNYVTSISNYEIISIQDDIDYSTEAHLLNQNHTNIDDLQENSTSRLETLVYNHLESKCDRIESKHNNLESEHLIEFEDKHIQSVHDGNKTETEEKGNLSDYETIKVSILGNVLVWEKSYSGSEEVSSCLSEAEDLLNCDDVLPNRER